MQAPAYCSYCYYISYFQIGSLHPPGIWLRDLYVLFSLQLQFMLMTPGVFKGGGIVRKYMCRCANMWADMVMCHSAPLGFTSW